MHFLNLKHPTLLTPTPTEIVQIEDKTQKREGKYLVVSKNYRTFAPSKQKHHLWKTKQRKTKQL